MKITSAKYVTSPNKDGVEENISINAIIDGTTWAVPLDSENIDFVEIIRQVDAGELTIEPEDE